MLPAIWGYEAVEESWKHHSVMVEAIVDWLVPPGGGGVYIDATLGSGGHAAALLSRAGPAARLLGIDRDPDALVRAARRLRPFGDAVRLCRGCFADLAALAGDEWPAPDGIVMDFGVSSDQLETPERGFSFMQDGPLDMRMDPESGLTAADWLARLTEADLAALLREYGEEPAARRIARAVVRERERSPIETTQRFAAIVSAVAGRGGRDRRHPATRSFQALRMAVNQEIEQVETGLEAALRSLRPDGRLAVLSFHSLEDRRVKHCFRAHAGRRVALAEGGSRLIYEPPRVRILTRRPQVPDDGECARNPRARSAKLRVAQRLAINGEDEHHETTTTKL